MSNEQPDKGKKKGKRMVTTNVRLTPEAHDRLRALQKKLGMTSMSDTVDYVVIEHFPDVESERKQQEARRRKLEEKRSKLDDE